MLIVKWFGLNGICGGYLNGLIFHILIAHNLSQKPGEKSQWKGKYISQKSKMYKENGCYKIETTIIIQICILWGFFSFLCSFLIFYSALKIVNDIPVQYFLSPQFFLEILI